jgi:rhodanese-related sulfurtransferase
MKKKHLSITILICLFLPAFLAAQEKPQLAPAEFEQAIQKENVQVLDVRTTGEYRSGHIKNSLQADWTNKQQFADRSQHLDKSKPLYVYCAVGGRSHAAAEWFRSNGYKDVFELSGGLIKWKAEQKPVEGVPEEKPLPLNDYMTKVSGSAVVLADFGAAWCPPCKKMEPVLQQLQSGAGSKLTLVKIDAGNQTELMKQVQVTEIPTFIVYKNGKETWRKQGIVSLEELKKQIE